MSVLYFISGLMLCYGCLCYLFAFSSKDLHNITVNSKIKEELSGQESEYSLTLVERVCCVHRVKCD